MRITIALLMTCLLCTIISCTAQKIDIEKAFGGYKFIQDGKPLKMNQLANIVSGNFESRQLMRSAKSKIGISSVISGIGGGLIGWNIGTAIGGSDPNWIMTAGGVVLAGIGFPIAMKGYKQAREAVSLYNKSLGNSSGSTFKPQFEIVTSPNRVGLLVMF